MSTPIYVPGREIRCTTDDNGYEFHVRGWSAPESEQTWIDGIEGELQFKIKRPEEFYTFRADIVPLKSRGVQTLDVYFNYFRVGFFECPEAMSISIHLPFELFIFRTARVIFHCRNAVVGHEVGIDDRRRLGIALRSWVIE
jgi:hypothetical protein